MQNIAKKQIKSSIRKMYDEFMKVREKDVVKLLLIFPPHIQRPFKTGLSYKYKIPTKRGNVKSYPSEILHDAFVVALILLPKRIKVKDLGSERE
jgi:hypothetical protein